MGNVDFVDLRLGTAIGRGGRRKESGLGVSDLGVRVAQELRCEVRSYIHIGGPRQGDARHIRPRTKGERQFGLRSGLARREEALL